MAHALVVDDSRAVRRLLAQSLHGLGYEVTEAENGAVALHALQASPRPVQLILTDWNMPEMSGIDFIKAVRTNAATKALPASRVGYETRVFRIRSIQTIRWDCSR